MLSYECRWCIDDRDKGEGYVRFCCVLSSGYGDFGFARFLGFCRCSRSSGKVLGRCVFHRLRDLSDEVEQETNSASSFISINSAVLTILLMIVIVAFCEARRNTRSGFFIFSFLAEH